MGRGTNDTYYSDVIHRYLIYLKQKSGNMTKKKKKLYYTINTKNSIFTEWHKFYIYEFMILCGGVRLVVIEFSNSW